MELELKKLTKEFQGFKAVDDITLTMSNGVYREAYYVMEKIFLHWMANIGEFLVIYLKNLDFIRSFRFMII